MFFHRVWGTEFKYLPFCIHSSERAGDLCVALFWAWKKQDKQRGSFDPIDMGGNFSPPLVNVESPSLMHLEEYLSHEPWSQRSAQDGVIYLQKLALGGSREEKVTQILTYLSSLLGWTCWLAGSSGYFRLLGGAHLTFSTSSESLREASKFDWLHLSDHMAYDGLLFIHLPWKENVIVNICLNIPFSQK